jgi:small-conductance mechanosensitive channel
MDEIWQQIVRYATGDVLVSLVRALATLVVGVLVARVVSRGVARIAAKRLEPHHVALTRRGIFWSLIALAGVSVLRELGFDLGVFLGAAGVLTVALGFASQTSASNLISGLFLIIERPFVVGDVIRVDATTGEVLSIDLLSCKLRTFDNLFVRLPNETLVKSQITNLTHFPIRRVDVMVPVAYREEIGRVREVLERVAENNPLSLEEPAPVFIFDGFGDSSVNLQFSVWAERTKYLDLKFTIQQDIQRAFSEEGIEIPFPQRTITAGRDGVPIPVSVVND